jgi:signal transduction histidine kinase/CheY-like chemotaxis protein
MRHIKENLLLQFSIASFIILSTIAVILAHILADKIQAHAIEDLTDEAVGASSGRLLNAITPADLETPMVGERYDRSHEFVQRSIVSDRTARVKLWAKDGTVIYSDDRAGVGEKFPSEGNLMSAALRGENAAETEVPEDAENARERYLGTLMEVYTPIIFPGSTEPAGAFEIYQYYEHTANRISALQKWVFGSVGIGFLALYGSLVSIVWRGWKTITRQRGQLESINGELEKKVDELGESNEKLTTEMAERKRLEEQLLHAQKMESIGRLAGGVAHDFNNLLTPIIGYAQMGVMEASNQHRVQGHLEEIRKAAQRAANLTSQLLAFSRRQVIEPKVINLNGLIADMDRMLRRLIGEDIELATSLTPDLKCVKADPGQMEQVLMNLVVNARDAMPQGGKVNTETANVTLDEVHVRQHPEASPGPYALVSVSDNGSGMPEEVQAHIFEPFFTTKEEGKGTGLGLATCYGIVRQSGGHIEVYSKVGQGTTFKIYLPLAEKASSASSDHEEADSHLQKGTETVLLAEDELAVRSLIARLLRHQGYHVLEAANGVEALSLAREHSSKEIHLLLTDVVMPQMGGIELAKQLNSLRPNTKILFVSGYTSDPFVKLSIPDQGIQFVQKPFNPTVLVRKVREVMDNHTSSVSSFAS